MIITSNMKEKMMKATKMGKKNVCAVIGAYKGTTYIRRDTIGRLMNLPDGFSLAKGKPIAGPGMWTGIENTRKMTDEDIFYNDLMRL